MASEAKKRADSKKKATKKKPAKKKPDEVTVKEQLAAARRKRGKVASKTSKRAGKPTEKSAKKIDTKPTDDK